MRLPPVLLMSLALSAWVSSGGQRRAQSLPPANVGDTRPADPGNRPRALECEAHYLQRSRRIRPA